jgi:hypothetical protein
VGPLTIAYATWVRRVLLGVLSLIGLDKPIPESQRADSNRLPLLHLGVCLRTF